MPAPDPIYLRAGDTEPIEMNVAATGLETLAGATIVIYFRKRGDSTNHVNGATCTVVSGLTISFDPVGAKNPSGNAFDAEGEYRGHVKITHSDGDITRHPGDAEEDVRVIVGAALG